VLNAYSIRCRKLQLPAGRRWSHPIAGRKGPVELHIALKWDGIWLGLQLDLVLTGGNECYATVTTEFADGSVFVSGGWGHRIAARANVGIRHVANASGYL
jgi:hypothetical protein